MTNRVFCAKMPLMARLILKTEIERVVKHLFNKEISPVVSIEERFGDYASNAAMALAKDVGLSPRDTAEKIKRELEKSETITEKISKIEVAGPGFLNFYVKDAVFAENLKEILSSGDDYGCNNSRAGEKVMIEFTDPNPFKEFHIGHLMGNMIGESIARLLEISGAEIKRAIYQGDVGMHVAKSVYGLLHGNTKDGGSSIRDKFEELKKVSEKTVQAVFDRAALLATAYAFGARKYESDESARREIAAINKKIYDRSDEEINRYYDEGKKWSMEYFEEIYHVLGMRETKKGGHFDYYYLESETGKLGKKIVGEYLEKGVFRKSDGAVVFPKEKSGLHTRVFINSEGLPTYEAKELGLAKIKYEDYPYDTSIIITGNEVDEYFKVLLRAMEYIYPDLAKKTKHISHGMLRLRTGKMSSRMGDVKTAIELIEDIKKRVADKISDSDLSDKDKERVVGKVSLAALKYSILKQSPGKDIVFDFEKSISFEGDSGPYLQYTYARCMSVLRLAEKRGIVPNVDYFPEKITEIEKKLYSFPDIISEAEKNFTPNRVCTYLIELARLFNSFYAEQRIVDERPESQYRVALTKATAITMKNGLHCLGIESPDKM